jgi:Fe-coproporphyrin III synthase
VSFGTAAKGAALDELCVVIRKLALTSPRCLGHLVSESFIAEMGPEFLWLGVTNACASRCVACEIWHEPRERNPLSPAEIEGALTDPLFRRLKIVVVSGGEPTLRDDLAEILFAIHRAAPRARVILSSNAMHPKELVRAVTAVLEAGMSLEVGVSLDGVSSRHDEVRGIPGLFERVDWTLRALGEIRRQDPHRLHLKVGFVLSDGTVEQLAAVRDYTSRLGIELNVQWYNQADYYGNVGRDLLSKRAELKRAALSLRPTVLHQLGVSSLEGKAKAFACTALHNFCLLKCNGDVVPCFGMWNARIGNIREASPSAIWRGQIAREARRRVRECQGCLNTCGVQWSYDADYLGRARFYLRYPRSLLAKLGLIE